MKVIVRRPATANGIGVLTALFVLMTGCRAPQPAQREHKMKYGPPPPGYVKIRGEAVPNWQPEDMIRGPRDALGHLTWYPMGPRPILDEGWSGGDDASGRVVSVAPHPTDPDIVYIASASGGIWKTVDGGVQWVPLTDELASLNHGCVALDPFDPDTVYVGTGEYTVGSEGDGLFVSANAGATWRRIATTDQVGSTCSRIIVDPMDPARIHVTGNDGYIRSDDGGATWTNYLSGRASDVAVNPDNPSIVYVGRHNTGVYRSLDGGTTFTELTNGLPSSDIRRIVLAVAASRPDTVYTAIINSSSGLRGLYKTTDGGDSWVRMSNTPNFPYPQGWYDVFLGVDPTDEDIVYGGGVFPSYAVAGVIKSTNGAVSWTDITYGANGTQLHPDQHAIAFGPDGTIWIGNDGGVWKSEDGGDTWINKNHTLAVTQNYNIALHPTDPAQLMGGTQDNGTVGRDLGIDEWPQVIGGDGGFLAYDAENPSRRYTTYVYLTVFRFFSGMWADITGPWDGDPADFIAPLVMDPNDPHTLLGGTNRVWRTHDAHAGANWTAISTSSVAGMGTVTAIAVAHGASDTIYVGSSAGKVHVTTDAVVWADRSVGLPSGQVSDIFINPEDPAVAYVAYHWTSGARVLRTADYGLTWVDVTGDMPSGVSARALAVDWRSDPPGLYTGSGVGVYSSLDGGVTWSKDGLDLPNVNIGDLAIDFEQATITAGTYGRGAWRAELPAPVPSPGIVGMPHSVAKNRYLSFNPSVSDEPLAFQLEMTSGPGAGGVLGWVGAPGADPACPECVDVCRIVDTPVYRIWTKPVVHIGDCGVVPSAMYELRATFDGTRFGEPLALATIAQPAPKWWADIVGPRLGLYWTMPDGAVSMDDVQAAIQVFEAIEDAPHWTWVDLDAEAPNAVVNMTDVQLVVLAFEGGEYPFRDPADCP